MTTQTITIKRITGVIPGLLLVAGLGYAAFLISDLSPYLDALVVGLLLGILVRFIFGNQEILNPGTILAQTVFIQVGLILYGVKLNFVSIFQMGLVFPVLIVLIQVVVFAVTIWIGKRLKVAEKTTLLLGVGTAICGASAIAVTSPAVEGESKDVSISLMIITILGTIGAIIYSLVAPGLGVAAASYGFFCASTLHQTGLVKAASAVIAGATEIALSVKLFRTAMLAPIAIILGYRQSRINARELGQKTGFPIPWFILAFIGMAVIVSLGLMPPDLTKSLATGGKLIFAMALTAIGIQVNLLAFWNSGMKPLYTGLLGWLAAIAVAWGGLILLG